MKNIDQMTLGKETNLVHDFGVRGKSYYEWSWLGCGMRGRRY